MFPQSVTVKRNVHTFLQFCDMLAIQPNDLRSSICNLYSAPLWYEHVL